MELIYPAKKQPVYPAYSPWDSVQTSRQLAPGVYFVSTASHGGLMVERDTAEQVLSAAARKYAGTFQGFYYFEEDEQCSIAFFERPDWFKAFCGESRDPDALDDGMASVIKSCIDWEWKYYEEFTGLTIQPGKSYSKDQHLFTIAHANDWMVISATSGTSWEPVPEGWVKVTATIGGQRNGAQEREFLVSPEEYKTRMDNPGHAFIIDLSRHQELKKG